MVGHAIRAAIRGGGAVKIIASIEDPLVIAKILEHLRRREAAHCADHAPRAPPSRPLTRPIE